MKRKPLLQLIALERHVLRVLCAVAAIVIALCVVSVESRWVYVLVASSLGVALVATYVVNVIAVKRAKEELARLRRDRDENETD